MHKAKTPKLLISILSVFALVFGGVLAIQAPATAADLQGCISSNYQPRNCSDALTVASQLTLTGSNVSSNTSTTITPTTDLSGQVTCSTGTKSFYLYLRTNGTSDYSVVITSVAGLSFSGTNGVLSGTTQATAFSLKTYEVLAQCSNTTDLWKGTLTIEVLDASVPALVPSSQTLSGTVGSSLTSTTLVPTNFGGSCTVSSYSINPAASAFPAGISFSTSTGTISGTPSAVLTSTVFTITATGSGTCNSPGTATATANLSVAAAPVPAITPGSRSVSGTTGTAITTTGSYSAANFTCTPVYSATLPAGLSISSSTGVISGTPTATSSATVTVTAACNSESATASVTFSVTAPAPVQQNSVELDRKVTICHRTHSETNPYVRITVDYNSVNKKSGHQGHDEIFAGEHVFKAGIYKRAKDKDWGDIIPADPTGFNRWQPLNWTTLGAQIYNGTVDGCPSYDPVKYYNALREAGVPEKKIKAEIAELETEQAEAKPEVKKTNITELKYTGVDKKVEEADTDKVTICHATNATTNPYRKITVSVSSVTNKAGHYSHDDIYLTHHVYDASVTYPANRKDWGDIIPADPTGKNRWQPLNWTALGQKIYSGEVAGCEELDTQSIYNLLREDGQKKKDIVADLVKQSSVDDDIKELDEVKYTGKDAKVEKSEPKEPVDPNANTNTDGTSNTDSSGGNNTGEQPAKVKIPDQSLSGIVWLDLNRDGLKDADEPFMPNITLSVVQLTSIATPVTPAGALRIATVSSTGPVYAPTAAGNLKRAAVVTVKTDANGFYLFPSLGAGDWKVITGIPAELTVTYDSQAISDGEIITTVPVASHAFTWVGLVGDDEQKSLETLTEILKENPNALPLAEVPPALQSLVVKARVAAKAAAAAEAEAAKPTKPGSTVTGAALAETGTSDLAWFYFGILLLLTGVALRLARTKR